VHFVIRECGLRLLLISALAVALVACGSSENSTSTRESGSGTPPPPQAADWGTTLPDDFPQDVPLYPGAQLNK
jgi:hypothetical protein